MRLGEQVAIQRHERSRLFQQVFDALTDEMSRSQQQFKIFDAIVFSVAVAMMHVFMLTERSSKFFSDYKAMLQHVAALVGHWMPFLPQEHVALMQRAAIWGRPSALRGSGPAAFPSAGFFRINALHVVTKNKPDRIPRVLKTADSGLLGDGRLLSATTTADSGKQGQNVIWWKLFLASGLSIATYFRVMAGDKRPSIFSDERAASALACFHSANYTRFYRHRRVV